jgi:hypothetical protein
LFSLVRGLDKLWRVSYNISTEVEQREIENLIKSKVPTIILAIKGQLIEDNYRAYIYNSI